MGICCSSCLHPPLGSMEKAASHREPFQCLAAPRAPIPPAGSSPNWARRNRRAPSTTCWRKNNIISAPPETGLTSTHPNLAGIIWSQKRTDGDSPSLPPTSQLQLPRRDTFVDPTEQGCQTRVRSRRLDLDPNTPLRWGSVAERSAASPAPIFPALWESQGAAGRIQPVGRTIDAAAMQHALNHQQIFQMTGGEEGEN